MAKTTDLITLPTISPAGTRILAHYPGTDKETNLGYIEGLFNTDGKLKEVAELAALTVKTTELNEQLTGYCTKEEIENHLEEFEDVKSDVTSLQTNTVTTDTFEKAKTSILDSIATVQELLNSLQQLVNGHISSISELTETDTVIEAKVNTIEDKIDATEEDFASIQDNIQTLQSAIEELDGVTDKITELKETIETKADLSAIENFITSSDADSKISIAIEDLHIEEYAKTSEVEEKLALKADKSELEDIKAELENKLEPDAIANFITTKDVNDKIDNLVTEYNLQVATKLGDSVIEIQDIIGCGPYKNNHGGQVGLTKTLNEIKARLDALEAQQADTAAAVNNYTAVVKDMLTPTEQS